MNSFSDATAGKKGAKKAEAKKAAKKDHPTARGGSSRIAGLRKAAAPETSAPPKPPKVT